MPTSLTDAQRAAAKDMLSSFGVDDVETLTDDDLVAAMSRTLGAPDNTDPGDGSIAQELAGIQASEEDIPYDINVKQLTEKQIEAEELRDRQAVRKSWGDGLRSVVVTSNALMWIAVFALIFIDIVNQNVMIDKNHVLTPDQRIVDDQIMLALIGATVAQAAAMALAVVDFGFRNGKPKKPG